MTSTNNSREQWRQDVVERQHNLTPADITRTSKFRASGLPRTAPLPIVVRWVSVCIGILLVALGVGTRAALDNPYSLVLGLVIGTAGLLLILASVRWTAK